MILTIRGRDIPASIFMITKRDIIVIAAADSENSQTDFFLFPATIIMRSADPSKQQSFSHLELNC